MQDYDRAIRNLNEALRLDPNNTAAYGNRGVCALIAEFGSARAGA
jgi:Flp pilus assembly protein TadD